MRMSTVKKFPARPRKPCAWMPFVAPNGQSVRYDNRGMVLRSTGLVVRRWKEGTLIGTQLEE